MENIDATLDGRGNEHGEFRNHANCSQELKEAMRHHPSYNFLPSVMQESLEMIQHKIARIINGNENHIDSWHDIQGYARLVERELSGENVEGGEDETPCQGCEQCQPNLRGLAEAVENLSQKTDLININRKNKTELVNINWKNKTITVTKGIDTQKIVDYIDDYNSNQKKKKRKIPYKKGKFSLQLPEYSKWHFEYV